MDNKKITKIINAIIYLLTIFLICMILYNLFLIFSKDKPSNDSPKNSVKVSPIYIEKV